METKEGRGEPQAILAALAVVAAQLHPRPVSRQ